MKHHLPLFAILAMASTAAYGADRLPIISTPPTSAETRPYDRACIGWLDDPYQGTGVVREEGMAATLLFDGDDVYLKNPVSQLVSDTYIKGHLEDDTLVFDFPQAIYENSRDGVVYQYVINRMIFIDDEKGGSYYVDEYSPNRITFTRDDETFSMEGGYSGEVLMGLTVGNRWEGYGDYDIVLSPFTASLVTPPAGVETQTWGMTSMQGDRQVTVGVDGLDYYVQGLSRLCPQGWVKGTAMSTSTSTSTTTHVIFDAGQYVGIDPGYDYRLYLEGGYFEMYSGGDPEDDYLEFVGGEDLSFSLDEDTRTLTALNAAGFCGGAGPMAMEYYGDVVLRWQPQEISGQIANPTVLNAVAYEPQLGGGVIQFRAATTNVDGYVLDTAGISYRLIVDGQPLVFDAADYASLSRSVEWMPLSFSDGYDFIVSGDTYRVYFYVVDAETVGVQQRYVHEGQTWLSDIMTLDAGGVGFVSSETPVVSETCMDLAGRSLPSAPSKGLYLRTVTRADGSRSTSKLIH